MPTSNKKIIFYAPPDLERWLAEESARTGAPIAELCRRAVRLTAFGENQITKQRPPQPVLFVPNSKQETR